MRQQSGHQEMHEVINLALSIGEASSKQYPKWDLTASFTGIDKAMQLQDSIPTPRLRSVSAKKQDDRCCERTVYVRAIQPHLQVQHDLRDLAHVFVHAWARRADVDARPAGGRGCRVVYLHGPGEQVVLVHGAILRVAGIWGVTAVGRPRLANM